MADVANKGCATSKAVVGAFSRLLPELDDGIFEILLGAFPRTGRLGEIK